ncbi:MAG: NADPH-dependent F420 reductase [Nitrososphaerota archaeon]|jgi:NADPH-dependent F420 reductase|nr:NADPH-dependent F420 reductase [Nitrososphaerota archaeon]
MTTTIALVGGTGDLGLGLACRFAKNYRVVVGSRDATRAAEAAKKVSAVAGAPVTGMTNSEAASVSDTVVLTIPDLPSDEVLLALKPAVSGKLVISPIVPMEFREGLFSPTLASGSAAEKVASVIGTRVAAAFHNVPAARLLDPAVPLDYDVLVAAETRDVFSETAGLVSSIKNLRPLYAGPLRASRTIEWLTPVLLNVGKLNRIRTPSVRVV